MDPAVLELEAISSLRIRSRLKSRGCRVGIPLDLVDGLDRSLDAAIGIHGKGDVGIAITHLGLRARPSIPQFQASLLRVERKQ